VSNIAVSWAEAVDSVVVRHALRKYRRPIALAMIHKRVLIPDRVRRPPTDGWSWIDRRFVRDYAPRLSHEAIALYFFLVAVADKDGLSFFHDATTAARLRISEESMVRAREELIREDLVAYRTPLTQVLSLPRLRIQRSGGELVQLGELFRALADGSSDPPSRSSP
jgi:hypothetical protein